jgi:hypothetical protein
MFTEREYSAIIDAIISLRLTHFLEWNKSTNRTSDKQVHTLNALHVAVFYPLALNGE